MAYCNECAFFTDAGRCRNGAAKRSDVGYFQAACPLFEEMKAEDKPENNPPKIESKQPLKPSLMEQEKPKTKHCNKCGRDLPLDAFGKKTTSKDGLQSWCKECQKASTINARAKRKETASPAPAPAQPEKKDGPNFTDIEERLQLIADKENAQMELEIKKAFCRWYRIEKNTPKDGDIVILFLLDGSTILRRWSSLCDKDALESRLFLKGRYPVYWCQAWQLYDIITLKSLELGLTQEGL